MSPYVMTLFWLMMMIVVSTGESFQSIRDQMRSSLFKQREELREEFAYLRECAKFEIVKKQYGEPGIKAPSSSSNAIVKKPYSLRMQLFRPPNEARFNIALVRDGKDKEISIFYTIFVSLLKRLVAQGWSQEEPHLFSLGIEEALTKAIIAKREDLLGMSSEEELSSLAFENSQLNKAWLLLLQGTKTIPSLLNFVRLEINSKASYKINFLFAEPLLIQSVIEDDLLSEKLIFIRDDFFSQMCFQEQRFKQGLLSLNEFKNRTLWRQELTTAVFSHCTDHMMQIMQSHFNFTLGQPGSYIVLKDPATGFMERKRYK